MAQRTTHDWSILINSLSRAEDGLRLALRACRSCPSNRSPESSTEYLLHLAAVAQLWSQLSELTFGLEQRRRSRLKRTTGRRTQ
jgi:hypothetical protein